VSSAAREGALADLISLIVSTYERAEALDLVLRSLERQTDRDFEIVVADDGSGVATAQVITAWSARLPLKHVWHPHRGPRLSEIRNRALRASAGDYCIFLDGDCLARPGFVAAHRRLAEPGWFVTGDRILLPKELTERVLTDGLELETWGFANWLAQRSGSRLERSQALFKLRHALLGKLAAQRWKGDHVSNMAFWRADLDRVDGFDAAGDGLDESEIFIRLIRSGIRRKDGRFVTAVLHLWHPNGRPASPASDDDSEAIRLGTRIRARRGVSALAEEQGRAEIGE
jgi:glycosyltransferase involved in cell wall biosynthesis